MNKKIYCDYAATTFVSGEVMQEMMPCFNTVWGNASSLHSFGREAVALVDRARDRVAKAINADKSSEVYFTSGGTEANNWAIKGIARANRAKGNHIITSAIEHESVLEACRQLEAEGFVVTYLPVDEHGLVSITDLIHSINEKTSLVSVMSVNNEVGTVQNIKTIANIAHEYGAIFHTDAVQAIGALKMNVKDMDIDVMSISGHKIYAPKGVGALYVKNGVKIEPILAGGNQERGLRAGTTNVPSIVGFGKAIEIATEQMQYFSSKKIALGALLAWYISASATAATKADMYCIEICEKAVKICENAHNNNYYFKTLFQELLAKAYLKLNDKENAKMYCDLALQCANSQDLLYLQVKLNNLKATIARENLSIQQDNKKI